MTVTFSSGTNTPELADSANGGKTLTLAPKTTEFVLIATTDPSVDSVEWRTTSSKGPTLKGTPHLEGGVSTATFTVNPDTDGSAVQVVVKDTPTSTGVPSAAIAINIAAEDTTDDDTDDGSTVAEVKVGEFGPYFAALTFLPLAALAVAVIVFAWGIISGIKLPDLQFIAKDQVPFGTWTERLSGIIVLASTTIGTVLLLLGTWLAALEVRGRLRLIIKPKKKFVTKGAATPFDLAALGKVIDSASRLRGTVAVLLAGTLLMLGSLWGVSGIADSPNPDPTQTGSTDPATGDPATGDPATGDPATGDPTTDDPASTGDGN